MLVSRRIRLKVTRMFWSHACKQKKLEKKSVSVY
jgi:hypothetical protein